MRSIDNMRHRLVIALVSVTLSAGFAHAQLASRWLSLSSGDPSIALDTTTLSKTAEGFPRVWLRMNYRTSRGIGEIPYTQVMWHIDINCTKRQILEVQTIHYAATGEEVFNSEKAFSVPAWKEVVPDTFGETSLAAFCKTRFARL